MTTAPDSTSYPFLALARRYGLDYGLVLSYSDAVEANMEGTMRVLHEHRLAVAVTAPQEVLPDKARLELIELTELTRHGPHVNPCSLRIREHLERERARG